MTEIDTAPMWARLSKGEHLPSDLGTALHALDVRQAQSTAVRALCDERDNPNWGKHAGLMMTKWVRAVLDGGPADTPAPDHPFSGDTGTCVTCGREFLHHRDVIDRSAPTVADLAAGIDLSAPDVHKPFTDDGITYCGWDKHEGCGEVWPCATERAKALFLAAALGEPTAPPDPLAGQIYQDETPWSPEPPVEHPAAPVPDLAEALRQSVRKAKEARHSPPAAPTHAFVDPPLTWARLVGQEPCGHLLDPDDQFSHCRRAAGDPIHEGGAA